ncbi:SDR family oxidoreductase [Exilibacterium tricleocarpae]|uniref:SDR family oxidoreductase n=1 Tax=Exilibacterium tricleocarpae TaxID=2591008 RepID=A0A545TVF0_9GAMM|nr:SDR family NAD(P)-dependent oxidoreductase [Exilibacterium tricleocarpae]TQV81199.1 SDR family oxidoreductase [Exilibacterium tricleocarpae]
MKQTQPVLAGKHAVVTGGGTGIGAAIVAALAQAGARVSLMGRTLATLETGASGLDEARAIAVDVTDSDSVATAFQQARDTFGAVDILINNAGQALTAPAHKTDDRQWRQMLAVNLDGVFFCCREVLPAMRQAKRGRIVTVASTAAVKGYGYVSAYCAAKHGALGLTRALALENAGHNITVNAVCPGYTETALVHDAIKTIVEKTGRSEAQALEELTRSNPQGRLVLPEEVANAVLWLCAPGAEAITGQAVAVAGGEVM